MGIGIFFDDKKLKPAIDAVWVSPESGKEYLREPASTRKTSIVTPASARLQLLQLIYTIVLQEFEQFDFQQKELYSFFSKKGAKDHLALLQAWRMYAFTCIGNLTEANNIRQSFDKEFNPEDCPEGFACFYVFSLFYADKNGYFEDYIKLAHETEEILKHCRWSENWTLALHCIARLFKSRAYSNYHRFEEADSLLEDVEKDIERYSLSAFIRLQWHVNRTFYYDLSKQRTKAVEAMLEAADVIEKSKSYTISRYTAYSNIVHLLNLENQRLKTDNPTSFKQNRQQQIIYLAKAEKLVQGSFTTASSGFFYYTKAWYLVQENKLEEALKYAAQSIRIFYRFFQYRFLAQAYTVAHHIYKQKALQHRNYVFAYKMARSSERMRVMTDTYYKTLLKDRIQSVEIHFKVKEKELNEKLLQQQIDAMNKEMQLTQLNLHEKILVLDELKTYVHSLKKKELETRQLINAIAKKIDSVKITEQDKSTLQEKLSENNKSLAKQLSAKYPSLSNLEIRMCTLFQTGMTNKELAKLYGQSEKAYEQHRYRIKKKMGLSKKDNLVKILLQLSA